MTFADKPMTSHDANSYKPDSVADGSNHQAHAVPRWPSIVAFCACSYYAASALTFPFLNAWWVGEVPPLAVFQIPKSFLKSAVHEILMWAVSALGMSRGSFSPDYAATHDWAIGVMTAAPALLLVAVFMLLRRVPQRRKLVAMILICAAIDAIVTFWVDNAFDPKLFNAMYF